MSGDLSPSVEGQFSQVQIGTPDIDPDIEGTIFDPDYFVAHTVPKPLAGTPEK